MKKTTTAKKSKRLSINWKFASLAILLTIAIIVQIGFNLFVWQSLQLSAAFQIRTAIVSNMEGLVDLRQTPDSQNRIPEARIVLPAETDDTMGIMYKYNKAEDDQAENLVITSKPLYQIATTSIPTNKVDDVFKVAPAALACTRGATIFFNDPQAITDSESMELGGTVKLEDGRAIYIWSDKTCGTATGGQDVTANLRQNKLDDLIKYLLQAKSY